MVDGAENTYRVDEHEPEVWARVNTTPPKNVYATLTPENMLDEVTFPRFRHWFWFSRGTPVLPYTLGKDDITVRAGGAGPTGDVARRAGNRGQTGIWRDLQKGRQ